MASAHVAGFKPFLVRSGAKPEGNHRCAPVKLTADVHVEAARGLSASVAVARAGPLAGKARAGGPSRSGLLVQASGDLEAPRRGVLGGLAFSLAAAALPFAKPPPPALAGREFETATVPGGYQRIFGQATSASSYGGYGGDETGEESYKYYYDVPEGWNKETVTKQEKGYSGVDSRYTAPSSKVRRAVVVTFGGYARLKDDKEDIMSDLAIADSSLQDAIAFADEFTFTEKTDDVGQVYVDYDIIGSPYALLSSVTTYGGRLYAILVWGSPEDYAENAEEMRKIRDSFATLNKDEKETQANVEYFKRAT